MNYSPLEELCGILENEVRKINGQLSSGSTIDGADADLIKDIVMTIYYIKKSMRVPYENEMRGYPQMGSNCAISALNFRQGGDGFANKRQLVSNQESMERLSRQRIV